MARREDGTAAELLGEPEPIHHLPVAPDPAVLHLVEGLPGEREPPAGPQEAAKISVVHVPYRGTPETITDTASGLIHFAVPPILAALPLVRDGRLVALGVTSPERSALLPDVPTVAEAGVPGYKYEGWFGFLAPAKTPKHIVQKIGAEIRRIAQMNDIKEKIAAMGGRSWPSTPDELAELIRSEIETRGKVFRAAGVKPAS